MPIFLFYGTDTYSRLEKLKFWRLEFEKKHGGTTNIAIFEGKNTSANEIFQTTACMPFLAEKRLTIIKDFLRDALDNERNALANLLEKIPDFSVVVFSESETPDRRTSFFKKIQKTGKLTEFPAFNGTKLLAWIEKTVSQNKGSIEREAILALSELSAGDLYRLENEIAKLTAYAGDRPITKSDIELLIDTRLSISIFRLTDSMGMRNKKVALNTLHQLLDTGDEPHHILSMIIRQFRLIACIKDMSESGMRRDEITQTIKEHPFVVFNTLSQIKNFTKLQLERAYDLLLDMDAKLKNGGIKVLAGDNREFVLALDRLVLKLCA